MTTITSYELARMIEHVQKLGRDYSYMEAFCLEAKEHHFVAIAAAQAYVSFFREILEGSDVHVSVGISFPLSQSSTAAKIFETRDAIEHGAQEIGFGVNLVEVKSRHRGFVKNEMEQIVHLCREYGVVSKCTFENCMLEKDEIKWLCEIASEVKPDYIKTSTGFAKGGATVEDVRLMRENTDSAVGIKAAAGIKTVEDALAMIEAGATRIGTSNGIAMMEELKAREAEGGK